MTEAEESMRSQRVDETQALARALVVGVVQATAHCRDSEVARALRRTAVSIGIELASHRAAHRTPSPWSDDATRRMAALGCLLKAATRHGDLGEGTALELESLQSRTRDALAEANQLQGIPKSAAT